MTLYLTKAAKWSAASSRATILCALIVSLILSVATSGLAASDDHAVKRIAILAEAVLEAKIQPSLTQYQADLEREGYMVVRHSVAADSDPFAVRRLLQLERGQGLEGAVLVGDILALIFT